MTQARRPSLVAIGLAYLQIGTLAFGGLGAALALLQRDMVERRGWLQPSDLSQALTYTKPLPGSTVVQVVTFLGWRLHGVPGALVATIAFLMPATALMIAAAAAAAALPDTVWLRHAFTGLQVAVVGLLASAMWRLARSEAKGGTLTLVLLASFAFGLFVSAALVVVGAGLIGVLTLRKDGPNA